jgi:hypothetical protein
MRVEEPTDHKSGCVRVGTRIRVLKVPAFLENDLAPEEWERVKSMIGEEFDVYWIDEHGLAWIEKWWPEGPEDGGCKFNHSLGLRADEMEIVLQPK